MRIAKNIYERHTQPLESLKAGTVFQARDAHYMLLEQHFTEDFGGVAEAFQHMAEEDGSLIVVHLGTATLSRFQGREQVLRSVATLVGGYEATASGHE